MVLWTKRLKIWMGLDLVRSAEFSANDIIMKAKSGVQENLYYEGVGFVKLSKVL